MAAPKGSKYALGHGHGRPCGFDIEEEAEELLKWSKTEDALILRYFAALRGYSDQTMYRWCESNDNFRGAYEYAKNIIGCRRERMYLDQLSESAFKRYATYYDKDLQLHEIEETRAKAKLADNSEDLTPEQINKVIEKIKNAAP